MNRRRFFGVLAGLAAAATLAKRAAPDRVLLTQEMLDRGAPPGRYLVDRPLDLHDDARLIGCDIVVSGTGMFNVVGDRVWICNCHFQQ